MSESPVPTPAETPAETIRRAAALMRQRAEAATPGPWSRPLNTRHKAAVIAPLPEGETGSHISGIDPDTGEREHCCVVMANTWSNGKHFRKRSGRDLEYIAAMHPGVTLLVVAWLEAELACHEKAVEMLAQNPAPEGYQWNLGFSTLGNALAVALMYLGEVS